ncbi:alcohol dehydrogenase [Apiospora phragmitis]|uniref:Alcohol dehydrogenase n=1 Tax=Apiospora phragmitis TaxID=2905665 RepID=A0ABR1VSM0_9PEZI
MPENRAAYLMGEKVRPLAVKPAPYPTPGSNQLLVRVTAVAVNPIEYIKQDLGGLLYGWVRCPHVLGSDVAGTVVEVGRPLLSSEEEEEEEEEGVAGKKRLFFRPGDRVVGHALGSEKKFNDPAMGAFQHYVLLQARMVAPIPDALSFERAAKDQLALRHPVVAGDGGGNDENKKEKAEKETLLIWGGSTSVGCNAIQLACAAGYEVVTTCSPRNFDLVKSLGTAAAFDYRSGNPNGTAVSEIVRFCQGKKVVGALSIGSDAGRGCVEVLRQVPSERGSSRRFLSRVSYPTPENKDAGLPARIWCMLSFSVWLWVQRVRHGIRSNVVVGTTLEGNEVGTAIYAGFLPRALATGRFVAAPEPKVVGKGLEFVHTALDRLRRGVSAKKLVAEI